jgi:parallel beta helix pectate lyase-like protein/polymorphic membrane protein
VKNYKKILIPTLLILFLISLSCVNAAENNTDFGDLITNTPHDSTIQLEEGTYSNNATDILIDKNITIIGKSNGKTIINANKTGNIFNIAYNGTLTLINITLTNGIGYNGGAIINNGELTITNCNFINNLAEDGGNGGAIYNDGTLIVTNSIFTNNTAANGGAIYNTGGNMIINNSIFKDNKAFETGGAISSGSGGNGWGFFSSNYPMIIDYNDYDILIINSIFTNNTAYDGGAIYNNQGYMLVENSTFTNNTADSSSAIFNSGRNMTIIGSNFTNNNGGATITLDSWNNVITGCNIINNTAGILITDYASNILVNYNRIFNNTDYDLNYSYIEEEYFDPMINVDYNWWGNNTPNKIFGITPNNYFVMNVTNLTSLDSNGTVTFNYTFKLNNTDAFNASLLPYFVTNVYTSLTDGVVTSFDARYDRTFDVTVNTSGNILYTFVTDNEIQTLEGTATIPDPVDPNDPIDPVDPVDPIDPVDPDDDINQTSNNQITASAAMKETGLPINLLLVVLLSILGFGYYTRKQ